MKTPDPLDIFLDVCDEHGPVEAVRRLSVASEQSAGRAKGPVQQLVAPDAKREGPEPQPEAGQRAHCAGEVREAVEWALDALEGHMLECDGHTSYLKACAHKDDEIKEMALALEAHLRIKRALESLLPEPDSEARNERSGRRNR